MSSANWHRAAATLRARLGPATADQRALAAKIGLTLRTRIPARIAAAELSDHLGKLIGHEVSSPSDEQAEYIEDLAPWSQRGDPTPKTRATASAWIDVLLARRALEALTMLKPNIRDIVVEWRDDDQRGPPDELAPQRRRIVASLGEDGTVHFRGGGGRRAPAHRIEVLYAADDDSPAAQDARRLAEMEATERARALRAGETVSDVKSRQLHRWHVGGRRATLQDVDRLRGVIDTAKDEQPIQLFLQDHPHLLAGLLTGAHGRWVCPQVRLGARYVADFLIADADSSGIHWQLLELESPRVRAVNRNGEWAKEARNAQHQIRQWRHYISENPDAARKAPEDEGLGLVDIEAGAPALILISRRDLVVGDPVWMRRDLRLNSGVEMHTYDWLIERVERMAGASRKRLSSG